VVEVQGPGEGLGEECSFEEGLRRLRERVEALTSGHLSLEESLRAFEEGVEYHRHCSELLRRAELRVTKLVETLKGLEELPLADGRRRQGPGGTKSEVP
jgi:exodeoxyribonuclease VII small subunit